MFRFKTLHRHEVIACAALALVTAAFTCLLFVQVLFSAPVVA